MLWDFVLQKENYVAVSFWPGPVRHVITFGKPEKTWRVKNNVLL
jgi:hypothetical protein